MSKASKLNRHLAGWRRGQPKPQAIVRTTTDPAAPRFINIPQRVRQHFQKVAAEGRLFGGLQDLPSREQEQRDRLQGRGMHGGAC